MQGGFFVPTRFSWRYGGQTVQLCGSFTRWVETVPMAPVDSQPGVFSVIVHLPPGYHQYKFIVDGNWRHDEAQPFMPDPLGNVNNWLFVRRPEQQHQQAQHQQAHRLFAQPPEGQQQQQQQQQRQSLAAGDVARAASTPEAPALAHPAQVQTRSPSMPESGSRASLQHLGDGATEMQVDPTADSQAQPITLQVEEPAYTRRRVRDFLARHTAYELLPESGKVVLLDAGLPLRQAFHALHEQGVASAPVWDSEQNTVVGMISASDFVYVLCRLRDSVAAGANPLSEAEMDAHTIRGLREEAAAAGRPPRPLVALRPQDSLADALATLFAHRCSMAPVLSCHPGEEEGGEPCALLHTATVAGILACLMRHFRASLASLPLLAEPLERLPLGTWAPHSGPGRAATAAEAAAALDADGRAQGVERRDRVRVRKLHTVGPGTPLTAALQLLLRTGVSVLPVVDSAGVLLDLYACADVTQLAAGAHYNRLQWEEVSVGQALALATLAEGAAAPGPAPTWQQQQAAAQAAAGAASGGDAGLAVAASGAAAAASGGASAPLSRSAQQRAHLCTRHDNLRSVVERLAVPGVRRLVVVDAETRRVDGIVSLSDVAAFLFDVQPE